MGATSTAGNVEKTKSYERAEAGVYPARCIQVVELGTRDNEYQGEVKKRKEIVIIWELSELMEDGRPFVVSWRGTNSLSDKSKLLPLLVSWRGKAFTPEELGKFEMKNILDKPCMINVSLATSKAGKDYNGVISVMPLPKGMTCAERANDLVDFGIGDLGTPEFEKVYPYLQKIILDSDEGKRFMGVQAADSYEDSGSKEAF